MTRQETPGAGPAERAAPSRRRFSGMVAALPALAATTLAAPARGSRGGPFRLAVIGLTHGHVEGLLGFVRGREDIAIVGIWEPNTALFDRMAARYGFDRSLRYRDLDRLARAAAPEGAAVMTSTALHIEAVRRLAPRGIHIMVEKPLARSYAEAAEMAALAQAHGVHVLTNYETSWYASNRAIYAATHGEGAMQPIRRVVFRHGHSGPLEIGVSEEFAAWLLDPAQNGDGALFDFGCYGANLMTWLMDGRRPQSVSATLRTLKPSRYAGMADDATITLGYADAVGVAQASWAWTHDNKETDVYTDAGSLHAGRWDELSVRTPNGPPQLGAVTPLSPPMHDPWLYFAAVARGAVAVDPLSSLENNLVVMEILDAAARSAREGVTVMLAP